MRSALTALTLLSALALPLASSANGRFPAAQFVTIGPGDRDDHLALRTTFGVIVSRDRGASWTWLCEEFFEYGTGTPWDPPVAWGGADAGAPLFVGIPAGLTRTLDGCTAPRLAEAARDFTGDVTTSADGRTVLWVSSNGTGPNRVLRSTDGGATFVTGATIAPGTLPLTIEVAGDGARRVYVTAVTLVGDRAVFLRSDDGGDHFTDVPLDLRGGRDAWLAGVDRTNPDVVYVRSSLPGDDAGVPGGTLLLRSTDGGAHFEELTRTQGSMLGFARSDDGRTLWVGGPDARDRLRRSTDGGRTFTRVSDVEVLCLRFHADALYVCAPYTTAGWALGRSSDGGEHITPLLRFDSLTGPPACPATATGAAFCAARWPAVRAMFQPFDAGAPDASTPADARALTTQPTPSCTCRAGHDARPPVALPLLAAALVAWRARRRRR